MARRHTPDLPEEPALRATKARAKEVIDRGIAEGSELLERLMAPTGGDTLPTWLEDRERWEGRTKFALDSVFHGPWPMEFHDKASHIYRNVSQDWRDTVEYGRDATRDAINHLRLLAENLKFLDEPGAVVEARPSAQGGSQVFVVHGHNRELRERVARLLERLDLEPIILEEQPDGGRTIIEKFEHNALNVGYAVVLLTPDDVGRGASEPEPGSPNRARQNVILELGYFMGALTRARVAALSSNAIERPSDIHGLLYIDVSRDGWELRLAREMRDAGLPVDLNRL